MPLHTVQAPGSSATPRHPSPFPPIWRRLRRTIRSGCHFCLGKGAQLVSDDFRLTVEGKVWSKRQRQIVTTDATRIDNGKAERTLVRRPSTGDAISVLAWRTFQVRSFWRVRLDGCLPRRHRAGHPGARSHLLTPKAAEKQPHRCDLPWITPLIARSGISWGWIGHQGGAAAVHA